MKGTVKETDFQLEGQVDFYRGKVRDVYFLENDLLLMIASDRISAFDTILPQAVPYKGQVLNQLAGKFLDLTADIVPNWKISQPDPNVTLGKKCTPLKVEMVVRGYLAGHAWREYRDGKREICGVPLPERMKQNEKFPDPIITPTTKADKGHDEDISKEEIISSGLVEEAMYEQLEKYSLELFRRGTEFAADRGLILVDTKYEFGLDADGNITLIDEIHTPDSSRYFYASEYEERLRNNEPQRQLSKEFVREELMQMGFSGQPGREVPVFSESFVTKVSDRYIELYEKITGERFEKVTDELPLKRIEENIKKAL